MTINLQTAWSMLSHVALVLITLMGGFHPAAVVDESPLEARVSRYWTLRQAKDLGALYKMYSSEYRSKVSRAEFLKLTRLTRFEIVSFQVEPPRPVDGRADVSMTLRIQPPVLSGAEVESRATQAWIRENDGVWYKRDEQLILPFPTHPAEASRPDGSPGRER